MQQNYTTKFDTRFFERYAKITLADLVDERFSELQNLDRPDLQDNNRGIGIEVTRAIRENKEVANALVNKLAGKPVMDVSEEDWLNVTHHGYSYGILENFIGSIEFNYWATALPLMRIIENKIGKVAKGFYGNYPSFGLYIFTKDLLDSKRVEEAIEYTNAIQKGNDLKYSTMYISLAHELFVCNLKKDHYNQIKISKSQCRKFYNKAIMISE